MRTSLRIGLILAATLALGLFISRLDAQQVLDPKPVAAVCAYNTSPPTVSSGQFVTVQCTATGSLLLH